MEPGAVLDRPVETRSYQYLSIQNAETLSPEFERMADTVNSMLEAVETIGIWAHTSSQTSPATLVQEEPIIRAICHQIREIRKQPDLEESKLALHELVKPILSRRQASPDGTRVLISSQEDLERILERFSTMLEHDLNNKVAKTGILQIFGSPAKLERFDVFKPTVVTAMGDLKDYIYYSIPRYLENYPYDTMTTLGLHTVFQKHLSAELVNLNIDVIAEDLEIGLKQKTVDYAIPTAIALAQNIGLNAKKAFDIKKEREAQGQGEPEQAGSKNQVILGFKQYVNPDDGKEYLLIQIQDNAIGFPQELLAHGFQKGVSGFRDIGSSVVSGTGRGMAAHQEELKQYGGRMILQNSIDAQGNTTGAIITIALPIK